MKENHIARMLRSRADKYTTREVFRYKNDESYQSIDWQTFKEQSEQIAKFLLAKKATTGSNIGIYSQNRPQWTISDLAILSIRSVVVPLYPTATFEQLKYIIDETGMEMLFVGDDEQLVNAQKALDETSSLKYVVTFNCNANNDERIFTFEQILETNCEEQTTQLYSQLEEGQADDLATIIYTSGTTGEPKGVMLHHSHFMHSFKIHDQRLSLSENDVSMCFLPLSHVFERTWTYYLLHCGGTNVYNVNPKAIIEELPKVSPTVMCVVPRFFEKTYDAIQQTADRWPQWQKNVFNWAIKTGQSYIEYEKDNRTAPFSLSVKRRIANALVYKKIKQVFGGNIRFMPCAGSALNNFLLRFFHSIGLHICYGYGTTETTATVSCMPNQNYDFDYTGDIMPDIEVKINEENMILVKGETVFSGYYKKPEQTAEVLKDGWYYTGDQGSIPQPGKLHMTERIKDIIKTSTGKYISPQKIELELSKSKFIEQICIIGDNRKYLTALIVPTYPAIEKLANSENIKAENMAVLLAEPFIYKLIEKEIAKCQTHLPRHEHVIKFHLLPEPFSIDNSMLTNSLKVRRKQVNQIYSDTIEAMY
ncbi:long-chain fatty acid--CoA ligase [Carboxylicivirga sediminis]|uniref:Long-chain fatty acid--CoA ligase n=1 Tax=Carboxylicivirga sediminis TaxID=2006564 RepID=A0A941F350_9BACT|nr:long-chain fatty acid--CoA ligase [Carboxylicivirga sediminis]MBR8534880.1 long-chain fatty acid--CoA ligase [Carboxylicivirga sediminis]